MDGWSIQYLVGIVVIVIFVMVGWRSKSLKSTLLRSSAIAAILVLALSLIAIIISGYLPDMTQLYPEWVYTAFTAILVYTALSVTAYGIKRMFTRAPGETTLRGPN